ncbi:MAG TPA: DUF423 domain-containing protein [Bacteroidia bacterium]|nr:DUF423 domain-containing protein [Bacteroidia bacterium]
MKRNLLLAGTLFALLAVLAGAFGSHALKSILSPDDLTVYETAVRYQFYHALALLFTSLYLNERNAGFTRFAGILFASGIISFSGSLYLITYFKSQSISIPLPVALATPLGGVMFACGWLVLAVSVFKNKI